MLWPGAVRFLSRYLARRGQANGDRSTGAAGSNGVTPIAVLNPAKEPVMDDQSLNCDQLNRHDHELRVNRSAMPDGLWDRFVEFCYESWRAGLARRAGLQVGESLDERALISHLWARL